jgi:hypothetical protein
MSETRTRVWTRGNRIVGFDPERRRIWVGGQRLHHGLTGIVLTGVGLVRLATRRSPNRAIAWTLAGGAMIAHDWKDRGVWFRGGAQAD